MISLFSDRIELTEVFLNVGVFEDMSRLPRNCYGPFHGKYQSIVREIPTENMYVSNIAIGFALLTNPRTID